MALRSSARSMQRCTAQGASHVASKIPIRSKVASTRNVSAKAGEIPEDMKAKMAQAMQDPAVAERMKQMQEMMQRPEMQQQLAEMQAYMQNQQIQQRMQQLRDDPELKGMFEEIQSGGMGALMRYMNDPKVLAKIGEKIGDVQVQVPPAGAAAASSAAGPAAAASGPEINDLFDAARYGDLEAVEDFIAIGKDVNAGDSESRTPLHYASGFDHADIAQLLLDEGADLAARDSKGNTPLHYAAGYGRAKLVELLLSAGCDISLKNNDGQTAHDLILSNERNPLNKELSLVDKLRVA